jgi:hypothetical protein
MSRRLDSLVEDVLDDHDLSVDSYAGQRVDEALRADATINALVDAEQGADHRQSSLADDVDYDRSPRAELNDARRSCERAARALANDVVRRECRTTIGGHDVDIRHSARRYCPSCEEDVEVYYLGTIDSNDGPVSGWVCGNCGAELQVYERDGKRIDVVEEGST